MAKRSGQAVAAGPTQSPKIRIGETGFEPATARPPAGCATRLRHSPWLLHAEPSVEPAPSGRRELNPPLKLGRLPCNHNTSPAGSVDDTGPRRFEQAIAPAPPSASDWPTRRASLAPTPPAAGPPVPGRTVLSGGPDGPQRRPSTNSSVAAPPAAAPTSTNPASTSQPSRANATPIVPN
jgi:hypothetical protein